MLPITRANLDNICCTCLVDIRPTNFTNKKVYIIKEDINLFKMLKETAYVTVLKNPLNFKFIDDYSRKMCQICFLKAQSSFHFLEKIIDSTTQLKNLLKSNLNRKGVDRKSLKYCCRICLNRQRGLKNEDHNKYLKWLTNFSGIENDEQLANNEELPKQLCGICLEKLRNVEEYWFLSTYSFKYIVSKIEKDGKSQNDNKDIVYDSLPQKHSVTVSESSPSGNNNKGVREEIFTIKYEEEGTEIQETVILNNEILKTNNMPEYSNEQKDSFDIAYADANNITIEDGDDDIDYEFVIVNAEDSSMTS